MAFGSIILIQQSMLLLPTYVLGSLSLLTIINQQKPLLSIIPALIDKPGPVLLAPAITAAVTDGGGINTTSASLWQNPNRSCIYIWTASLKAHSLNFSWLNRFSNICDFFSLLSSCSLLSILIRHIHNVKQKIHCQNKRNQAIGNE